jgi:hypothetical protein
MMLLIGIKVKGLIDFHSMRGAEIEASMAERAGYLGKVSKLSCKTSLTRLTQFHRRQLFELDYELLRGWQATRGH